jgi:hypothetical protein
VGRKVKKEEREGDLQCKSEEKTSWQFGAKELKIAPGGLSSFSPEGKKIRKYSLLFSSSFMTNVQEHLP